MKRSNYAAQTSVSEARTREEIEHVLNKYGADQFGYGREDGRVVLMFRAHGRQIRFDLNLPKKEEFALTDTGRERADNVMLSHWEQACKARYRSLLLTIKAKLESIAAGIEIFEEAFLAQIVMPDGKCVGDHALPAIEESYSTGRPLPILPPSTKPQLALPPPEED